MTSKISSVMAERQFDVVVVGAGIMGSSTAYYLSKKGLKVALIEQFRLPHTRGSSHGQTRGIRKAYPQDYYVRMVDGSLDGWDLLARKSGMELFRKCDLLIIGEVGSSCLEESHSTLMKVGCPHERMSHRELSSRYPQFNYPENYEALLDKDAGILWASKALLAYQTEFRRHGGILLEGERVTNIIQGQSPRVVTSQNSYACNSVVITAGPWAPKLLQGLGLNLGLKTHRVKLQYWRLAPESDGSVLMGDNSPSMSEKIGPDHEENYIYHSPPLEYPGHAKICMHNGPIADPENPDVQNQESIVRNLTKYVKTHFPAVVGDQPSITESCMYTITPDHHFIIDHHPIWKNVIIGAGFSGHGFKMAPVIGQVLGELAMGETPSYDITAFSIRRFPRIQSAL